MQKNARGVSVSSILNEKDTLTPRAFLHFLNKLRLHWICPEQHQKLFSQTPGRKTGRDGWKFNRQHRKISVWFTFSRK